MGLKPTFLEVKKDGEAIISNRNEHANIIKYLRNIIGSIW